MPPIDIKTRFEKIESGNVLLISGSEIDLMKNCFVRVLAIEAAAQIKGGVS